MTPRRRKYESLFLATCFLEGARPPNSQTLRTETFDVSLSNPSNAILGAAVGTGTIVDDGDSVIGIIIRINGRWREVLGRRQCSSTSS